MSLAAIMAGIETRLATIEGLRTGDVSPTQIIPPYAFVAVPSIPKYRATMQRGRVALDLTVYVLVGTGGLDRSAQLKLAGYLDWTGADSIPLAIEGDRTLGGTVEDVIVNAGRPLGLDEVGALGYFGGTLGLSAVVRGTA